MDNPADRCYHCHAALPERPLAVRLHDPREAIAVCSQACATAVKSIHASGLEDFYRHRAEPVGDSKPAESGATDWRTYERPAVMREFVRNPGDGSLIADLLIQGVHCAACTWLIENSLRKNPGVLSVSVNPVTTRAELRWDPNRASLANLLAQTESLGYLPTPFT